MTEYDQTFTYKIILLGDSGTGKTSIALRYKTDNFPTNLKCTIGVDFISKTTTIDNIVIKLNIFDTAGQQKYGSVIKNYFNQVDAVIFTYSITNIRSFQNITNWLQEFNCHNNNINVLKFLVGTKTDEEQSREVSNDMALKLMEKQKFNFLFQTSSKLNSNINLLFNKIGHELLTQRIMNRMQKQKSSGFKVKDILLQNQDVKKKKCC